MGKNESVAEKEGVEEGEGLGMIEGTGVAREEGGAEGAAESAIDGLELSLLGSSLSERKPKK